MSTKTSQGMKRGRAPWEEKLRPEMKPAVVTDPKGRGKMLLPTPLLVAEEISKIPKGGLVTVAELRLRLARRFGADCTCPLMTGIFYNIVAGAAEDRLAAGQPALAPYWRGSWIRGFSARRPRPVRNGRRSICGRKATRSTRSARNSRWPAFGMVAIFLPERPGISGWPVFHGLVGEASLRFSNWHNSINCAKNAAMNSHAIRINSFRALRILTVGLLFSTCSMFSVRAASDTDVTIIKVEKVVVEEGKITITAQARTTVRLIGDTPPAGGGGSTWMGRPVTVAEVMSDRATFIIKRPELNFNDPDGTHTKEKEMSRKALDDAWEMSLAAAKELHAGREVGRIGFYAPKISINENLIDAIAGYGYLYQKGR